MAPAEAEPKAAHDHSHAAARLDWYLRLPGGHDDHVLGLFCRCEYFPTLSINALCDIDLHSYAQCVSSPTWCTAGSCTRTGLCWMQHRPWSACSSAFLTTRRLVWGWSDCIAAECESWLFLSVCLLPPSSGSELQSSAWCFPHWLLHRIYDLCGAEPLHLRHSSGIQSRADTSQGNSLMSLNVHHHTNLDTWCLTHSLFFWTAIRRGGDCGSDAHETLQFVWNQM